MKKILFFTGLCLFLSQMAVGQSSCLPGTSCANAPLFCGYTLQNNVFNNGGYPPGDIVPGCGDDFDNHNSQWFKIIPCSTPLALYVEVLTTDNLDGLQIALYHSCENFATVACNPGQPFGSFSLLSMVANVTPGEVYYIQVDGYSGDVCDYRFVVANGLPVIAPDNPGNQSAISGTINSASGNALCALGAATFEANWPGCDTLTHTNPLGCYAFPLPDTCGRLDWDFPQGTIFLSDSTASPVSVDFANVPPGLYTIKVRPRPCHIPDSIVCPLCLPLPCPVEELALDIVINAPSISTLPPISLCASAWPPVCNMGSLQISSDSILCVVGTDAAQCSMTAQPYILSTNDTLCPPSCSNYNFPAHPGDACSTAPLFCGSNLEGYCSSNAGMNTDTLANSTIIEHAAYIRIPTCSDSLNLTFSVRNCHLNQGLTFYTAAGQCPDLQITASVFIPEGTQQTLFSTVSPDSVWYLVVGGTDQCEFQIDTVQGIGTGVVTPPTCSCQDGYIDGPTDLCPGDIAQYTVVFPVCEILDPGGITGGNGYVCCPPSSVSSEDWHYVWHTSPDLVIVGDSVDVTSIQVEVNPDLVGIDTNFTGLIFITYQPLSGSGTVDTLSFCGCLSPGCGGAIPPKPVNVSHDVHFFYCELTCSNPTCIAPNGIAYTSSGIYVESSNCETWNIVIIDNIAPPSITVFPPGPICLGEIAILEAVVSPPTAGIQWSTGENAAIILVSPLFTTSYQVVATDWSSGCTAAASVTVEVQPMQFLQLGELGKISCTQPCVTTPYGTFCSPGDFSVSEDNCLVLLFSIGEENTLPQVILPPILLCQGECAEVNGSIYCASTTVNYTSNCTNYVQGVILNPYNVVELGQYTISCTAPCTEIIGQSYCSEGIVTDTIGCEIYLFEVVFEPDTIQLGQIGVITCQQPCVAWNGLSYCQPGSFVFKNDCSVFLFTVGSDNSIPGFTNVVHQCLPDNNSYYIAYSITGTPPFKVNGGPVAGSYFESVPYNNGANYQFLIEQTANGCQTVLSGQYDCASLCPGAAAELSGIPVALCGSGAITVGVITPAMLPTGQVQEFLLHTGSDPISGLVQRSLNGVFQLSAWQWAAGQQYNITAVAGPDNGSGMVELGHVCTHFSAPQLFVWSMPAGVGSIAIEAPDCEGETNGWIYINNAPADALFRLNNANWGMENDFGPLPPGNYTVGMLEANGCLSDTLVVVPESDTLVLMLSGNTPVHLGEPVVLSAASNASAATYEWANLNTGAQFNAPVWTVGISEDTRFFCTVTSAQGCTDTASLWIQLLPESIYYPNVIKPEDADNRWFSISSAPYFVKKGIALRIFDRWGNVVFNATPFELNVPEAGWDGSIRGKKANPDVYTFVAEVELYNGVLRQLTGSITVVR